MRLLLDAHLSPRLAESLRQVGIETVGLQEWRDGTLLNAPDEQILAAAANEGLILVTSDRNSMPKHLSRMFDDGDHYGGIILIRTSDTRGSQIGSVSRRMRALLDGLSGVDWTNRAVYLPPDDSTS